MAGRVAPQAEVAGRVDQSLAEVPVPDAVDEHPGRQRVRRRRRSPGPARAGRSPSGTAAAPGPASTRRNRRGTALPGRPGLPRMKTCGSTGCGASLSTIARGGAAGSRRVQLVDRAVQLRRADCAALDRGTAASASIESAQRPVGRRRAPGGATPTRARRSGVGLAGVLRPAAFSAPRAGRRGSHSGRRPRPCSPADWPSTTRATSGWIGGGLRVLRGGQLALDFRRPGGELARAATPRRRARGQDRVVRPWPSHPGAASSIAITPGAGGRSACRPAPAPPASGCRASKLRSYAAFRYCESRAAGLPRTHRAGRQVVVALFLRRARASG